MFAIAALAAAFAWWWNYNRGRKALEFYGPAAATLIRTAPKVELLAPGAEQPIDISHAPGLINARTSLLNDASYLWTTKTVEPAPQSPAVRFSDGDNAVVVSFYFPQQEIRTSSTGRIASLTTKTAHGWKQYLSRYIEIAED